MTAPFLFPFVYREFDNAGLPAAGYHLWTYAAGGTVPKATYSDAAGTVPNTNPVVLDTTGSAIIRLGTGTYNFVLKDPTDTTTIKSADNYQSPYLAAADIGTAIYPRTAAEIAAAVTPSNYSYGNNPHDIRRYGAVMDGVTDDAAAWAKLALVMTQGGNGYVPPGKTYVTASPVFNAPSLCNVALYGYGVMLYTNNGTTANAIAGLTFSGGGNSEGFTVYGITYNQIDAVCVSGFYIYRGSSFVLQDCAVIISNTVRANAAFGCVRMDTDPSQLFGYWNKVFNFDTRQVSGNAATYAPYGVLVFGIANALTVRDCKFTSVSSAVGLLGLSASIGLANAVLIEANHFEGGVNAVSVNGAGVTVAHIEGLRIINNRFESLTGGALQLLQLTQDSSAPTWMSGNVYVSSTAGYVSQANVGGLIVTVNNWEPSVTPAYGTDVSATAAIANGATSYTLQGGAWSGVGTGYQVNFSDGTTGAATFVNGSATVNFTPAIANVSGVTASVNAVTGQMMDLLNNGVINLSSVVGDVILAGARTNYGISLWNRDTSIRTVQLLSKAGSGGAINFPAGGGVQVSGTQVVGAQITGYGTPTGGSHQASFAAGSITLPNLAAAVAQLIIDLKTHGVIGT